MLLLLLNRINNNNNMSSVKSTTGSLGGVESTSSTTTTYISGGGGGGIVRAGYLKKLKTSKKRYFVLRAETCESSARLEYYENEKKFNSGHAPKRSIPLKTCFNINKRLDTKHKHCIALYTKDDCFCVVFDGEEEMDAWLKALLSQQQGEEVADGATPRPTFEHVWQVTLLNRGLGATPMISGYNKTNDTSIYRLCLTDKTLSLIRKDCDTPQAELSLSSIRSCGSLKNYFYLEAGRSSGIGAGELWMETEDSNIAQNVHQTVFHKMTSSSREDIGPKVRNRSSSATESSKPNNVNRKQMTSMMMIASTTTPTTSTQTIITSGGGGGGTAKPIPCFTSAGNVAWPGTVNHQRTRSLPLAHPAPLTTDNPIHPPRAAKRSTNPSKCFTDGRVRSDSMPSRPRTTSEGNHPLPGWDRYLPPPHRPVSIHRDISHSPPSGSPVSPPSATSTSDSAGSSQSIDESEGWYDVDVIRARCTTSITPDEAIVEENCDDCTDSPCLIHSSPIQSSYVPMAPISSDDGYVDMSPRGRHLTMSPAASMSSVTSGTPSTEYPLEKVSSYFPPSEEEECGATERPRTYSMGSKPYKSRIEQARDRAWSVGSKSKKVYNRVLPPHGGGGGHQHAGGKSSSAPMLSNSRLHSSHSSIDPMDDLMEMDFSRPTTNSGYMDMKPVLKAPHGYVRMCPGHVDITPYVDMRPGSSPIKPSYIQNDYMEMDHRSGGGGSSRGNRSKPMSTSPQNLPISPLSSIASTSPLSNYQSDYCDMNYQSRPNLDNYIASPVRSTLSGFSHGSPSSVNDLIEMDYTSNNSRSEPDGYVEMSLVRTSSSSSSSQHQSDYTNMSLGGGGGGSSGGQKKPKKDATRSQPITIQNAQAKSSPMYSPLIPRTPPKMYLPLQNSNYSSLPRQRSRKNSRRDSKDSSSSSVTTPSSSSTIFPFSLNSPSSPSQASSSIDTPKPQTTLKIPQGVLNAKYTANFRKDDYTTMDFSRPLHDYVNYKPTTGISTATTTTTTPSTTTPLMNRLNNETETCATTTQTTTTTDKDVIVSCVQKIANLDLSDYSSMCFKPIDESRSECNSRPSSESSEVSSTSTIVAIGSLNNNNNNNELLHYASLDLDDSKTTSGTAGAATAVGGTTTSGSKEQESGNNSGGVGVGVGGNTNTSGGAFTYAQIDFNRSTTSSDVKTIKNNK